MKTWNPPVSGIIVRQLDSLSELRKAARAWDELWRRGEIELPSARAELVALWCESFAAGKPFRAYVVERDGQAVAALPLVESRWRGLKIGLLPGNHWSSAGDLLLDPRCEIDRVCGALLEALKRHAWPLLDLRGAPAAAHRWQAVLETLDAHRVAYARRPRFTIDTVEIEGTWKAYLGSRSRNHRHHLRNAEKRSQRAGPTQLVCHDRLSVAEVEPLLRTCFEVEMRGWKGEAKSAVLNAPAAWEFYLRQARQLAAWGQLSLTLLTHAERPIAFEYGWRGKGVYFSPKVGYDESFSQFSPGQLLRSKLFEQFHRQPGICQVDFLGPSSWATAKWATGQYPVDRVLVATRGLLGRSVVAAYRQFGRLRSVLHGRRDPGASGRQAVQTTRAKVLPDSASGQPEGVLLE